MKTQRKSIERSIRFARLSPGRFVGLVLALTLPLATLPGCSDSSDGPAAGSQHFVQLDGPSASQSDAESDSTTLGESRLFLDPLENVAHRGVRLVEAWAGDDGVDYSAVRDELVTDGAGGFALRHLEALTPVTPSEPLYGLLKEHRQAFYFRYMMFRPIDQALFLRNWQVSETGMHYTIAGRPGIEVRISHRSTPAANHYVIVMDEDNGLVLRAERSDANGVLRYRMTYESVDLAPDLSSVVFHAPTLVETPLDPRDSLDKQMGFEVHTPRIVPKYFRPVEVSRVAEPGQKNWIKIVYSDGIDTFFFLQEEVPVRPDGTPINVSLSAPVPVDPLFPDTRRSDTLHVRDFGLVTVLDMNVDARHTFLMGRQGADQLLDIANSTLPEDYPR
ncbi:MAG: hypothetical protein WD226_01585 [Planctomycetota bacterium]